MNLIFLLENESTSLIFKAFQKWNSSLIFKKGDKVSCRGTWPFQKTRIATMIEMKAKLDYSVSLFFFLN